jgi:antirestriction protein ArdC
VIDPIQRIQHAETFFANLKADIRHGGNRAYYATGTDHVQMPPFEAFRDAEIFAARLRTNVATGVVPSPALPAI